MCRNKKLVKLGILFFTSLVLFPKSVNMTGEGGSSRDGTGVLDVLKGLVIGKDPDVLSVPENGNFEHSHSSNYSGILFLASPSSSGDVNGGNGQEEAQSQINKLAKERFRQEEREARKAKKALERVDRAIKMREMMEGPKGIFEAKYLFKNGAFGNTSKSFDYLCTSSEIAKEYLVDLNLKWYKGAVLPETDGNQFESWFNNKLEKRFVLIVDQDITVLQNDIKLKFDFWKNEELEKNGVLSTQRPHFETTEKQIMTQISYHAVRDENKNIVGVDLKATHYKTYISLETDVDGNLTGLEGITTDSVKPLEEKMITRFTLKELERNAQLCEEFWKILDVPRNKKAFVLNEEYAPYKQAKKNFKERFENEVIKQSDHENDVEISREGICFSKFERKRSLKNGKEEVCAIYIDKETGNVETIQAEEFLEKYENGNTGVKEHLSKLAKENMNKVIIGDGLEYNSKMLDEAKRKILTIVEMERIKYHATLIGKVSEVLDLNRINGVTPKKFLQNMKESLGNSKVKLSNSKLVIAMATSKYLNGGFVEGADENCTKFGSNFLTQTVVNGIMQGDATALAIIGSRVGHHDKTAFSAISVSRTYSSSSPAEKVAEIIDELGEWTEKGVDAVDFALNLNSFAKDLGRYLSSENQYDRNDDLADVIEDSIGMAITAAVIDISASFPPLAPIAAVAGYLIDMFAKMAVSLFKAWNEVNRIDNEIGLLDFEKREVFESRLMDWFGTRRKDYIDYTMEEKALNDLMVEYNLEFLKNNEDKFRGIVFPSRTLNYDGGCTLTKQYCAYEIRVFVWICTYWEAEEILGRGCDWNKPCYNDLLCTDFTKKVDAGISYNQYSCKCDGKKQPQITFGGYERKNQFVDFRGKQTVFWERAVPSDVNGGEFKCKPGSKEYRKETSDYMRLKDEAREDYFCENAIGLLQPKNKWRDGQAMLFDLKDGTDTVFQDGRDNMSSIFRVGKCGVKNFVGSGGKNDFVIDGEGECEERLEGKLVGGQGITDAITIMRNFSKGDNLRVDFKEGFMRSGRMDKVNMKFEGVEELTGRDGEMEEVIVGCNTRRVALRKGRKGESDTVMVPENNGCWYNLTVVATAYTSINSKAKQGNITLLIDDPFTPDLQVSFDIYSNNTPKVSVIFIKTPSRQITHEPLRFDRERQNVMIRLKYWNGSEIEAVNITFRGQGLSKEELERDVPIYFVENPSGAPYSALVMSLKEDQQSVVYHTLPPKHGNWKIEEMKRFGSVTLKNAFEIKGNDWIIYGGNMSDDFVVQAIPLEIHGNDGDEDTVRLHKDLNGTLDISLNLTSSRFTGIENVIGSPNKSLRVTCACDTQLVAVMGGPSPGNRNEVTIPQGQKCGKRAKQLQIVAKGNSRVEVMGRVADFKVDGVVVAVISSSNNITNDSTKLSPLSFEFEGGMANLSGLLLNIQLSHKNWTVTTAKREGQHVISSLIGINSKLNQSESIKLKLTVGNLKYDDTFVANPFIQVGIQNTKEVPGQLVIEKETGNPNVLYMLRENASTVEGFKGISNIFRVMNCSWTIIDGGKNDLFYVLTSAVNGTEIDGSNGGENTLILETSTSSDKKANRTFGVNLENGTFGYLGVVENEKGRLAGIHHVVGRSSKPDMIYTTCSTKSVNGREGLSKGQEDTILISGINCTKDLELAVDFGGKFTNVKNSAQLGSFIYYVRDWMTNGLDLNVIDENQHSVNFRFDPWTVVKDVEFKKDNKSLKFQLMSNESSEIKTQVFQMAGNNNETGEYTNPVLRFHQPGSPITTDIRVSINQSVVMATILLRGRGLMENESIVGLPVDINRFLINVTTTKPVDSFGGLIRGSSKSKANRFWIFRLNSTLDILDGGAKNEMCDFSTKNYLHLADTLLPKVDLEIHLSLQGGFLRKVGNRDEKLINHVKNIQEFHGRNISTAKDTAYVTCNTQIVYQVENVFIRPINETSGKTTSTCSSVNLVIGLGNDTKVVFLGKPETSTNYTTNFTVINVFHYKFTVPRSFDLETVEDDDYSINMLMSTASHNYYLAIKLDDLKSLQFDLKEECLSYSLFSTNMTYSHHMISSTTLSDQFYPQPVMITQDGFMIQVARTGSILLSLGASQGSFPSLENIQSKVIPALEKTSKRLDVTIMVQTDKEFLYIGHDANSSENRNVLENNVQLTSHLVGSGGNDTIYEIKSLKNNVYVYSGLEQSPPNNCDKCPKQTVDLTDVVMAIRMNFGVKYVPSVKQLGKDLVISMEGHENEFPGKLVIVNGTLENVFKRFQFLLHVTMMDLIMGNDTGLNWKLVPRPLVVPQGYVYSKAASDLEKGHDIQFDTSVVKLSSTSFTAAKNGYDLYLSDIKTVNITATNLYTASDFKETTTVIITDFYKRYAFKPRKEYSLADFDKSSPYPMKVFEVKISLPGLSVVLNDTQVLEKQQNGEITDNLKFNGGGEAEPMKLTPAPVLEWKCLLHDLEQQVLGDMQDIQRIYYRDECVDHYWTNIAAMMGSFIGGVLILVLIANWRLIRDKMGKRSSEAEEERQPLWRSQSNYQTF